MAYTLGWIEIHAVDHCNNTCAWCNNHAPHAPRRHHQASAFLPWLDLLEARHNVTFQWLSVMGGEPFLHPDLAGFMAALRPSGKRLLLTTNGYWLAQDLEKHAEVFRHTDKMFVTHYPNIVGKLGGPEAVHRRLDLLRNMHPHLTVESREHFAFYRFGFTDAETPVQAYCHAAECTALLPDGRLARCGVGGYAGFHPQVTPQFLNAGHMFFDLKEPAEEFLLWRKRYPLDACSYCTHHQGLFAKWRAGSEDGRD